MNMEVVPMTHDHFHYRSICSAPGCALPATLKIASVWSDGRFSELKTYGLACAEHARELLDAAHRKQAATRLAEGETLDPPGLFRLEPGRRDAELERVG